MAPQLRARPSSRSADSDRAASLSTDGRDEQRRARKRATDRKSQREHRERQRAYIQQLEETVRTLTETCATNGNERAARLVKEQERLQDKCNRLESVLRRIKGMIGDEFNTNAAGAMPDGESGLEQDKQDANELSIFVLGSEGQGGQGSSHDTEEHDPHSHGAIFGSSIDTPRLSAPALSHELDFFDLTGAYSHGGMESDFAAAGPSLCTDDEANQVDLVDDISAAVHPSNFDLVPASLGTGSTIFSVGVNTPGFVIPMDDDGPLHLSLPLQSPSNGPGHTMLASMLEEARQQNRCGKFDTSPPSLKRLLSDPPPDILCFRLFHYITSYGAMPLHLLLSIFWVQYLFLRWRVRTTVEDFLRVPDFLRPTSLERRVPHQLCINMIVWPDIRRTLIRDSGRLDPEQVGAELLQHLRPNWSAELHATGDLIGSMDVLAIIEKQATNIEFWKVDKGFLKKYPQYAHCEIC